MSSSDENECPLCMEPLDVDDLHFYPCTCHYQICRFCWHRIRTDENGLCPACRKPYSENPVTFKPLSAEEFQKIKAHKKKRENQRKRCTSDNRKHLASLRVVQKNLVFAVGLSPRLADPEVLKKQDYFGKFGKIIKVVMNHSSTYAGGSQGPSASAYITFARAEDAIRAIHSVNNVNVDGRTIKTSLGTTKYCSMFLKHLPCNKADCMYLHEVGDEAASFTKEDMNAGKHTEYEKRLYEDMMNQINNPLQELLIKSKSSSNIPRGAAAEPCPIPEHPVASSGTSLPTRPAPGTSPIEIPVLPSKKTKKRGKDKRQSDSAASAQVAKSPKNKVIVVPSGSSSSTSTASGSTTGAKAKARGTSAEESSGSDRGCSSSPPLLARIVAGATASASSGVKSAEGRNQTMAEVLMKREPSPAGSPGRMSDILLDDGTGASSGYASGSSASSSLQNSRYCAVAASSSSSSASSSSVIPSISTNVQETQQQEQQPQHGEQRVEDVQKVFEQEQQQKEETAGPVEREAEKTGGFAHRVSDYEVSLMRGDFDDLGFDPFAETQKAFAEILDKEVPEASSYGTTVPTSMTPERTNGESGRLSIPPGFSPEHLLPEANAGRIEQPVPSYASGLSEGGSKFLPFLLRNQASQPAPATSVHDEMNERSRMERLMAGLGGPGHYMDRQQTSNNHLQSHMHFNHHQQQQQQHHHHHLQQQQRQEEFARLQHRQYQPVEERQPVLAFLRSRGLSQEMNTPTSMPTSSSASHTRDSSLYSWNEWEDSLKTLFPTSSGSSTNTVTSMSSQQHARPPPPGLGMPAPEASGGIARSRFLEDLFGMKTQPIPGSSMGGSASTTTASGDWLEMDPAIVSTTRHAPGLAAGTSSLPIPSRDSGRNSPPAWLLQSLEQLTNDSPPEASPPPVHQFLQFRRQMQPRPTMSSIPPGFWPSSASSQPPPGLAPPPGFGGGGGGTGGGGNIPHSFESPFAPSVGGRPLPHDIFSNDSRLHQQRSALES